MAALGSSVLGMVKSRKSVGKKSIHAVAANDIKVIEI